MANEVTITVVGRDRTGGMFSGLSKRANAAFGEVRQTVKAEMEGAAADAESGGRSIGDRMMTGTTSAVSGRLDQFTTVVRENMARAGEAAGADFGGGIVRGADERLRDAKGRFMKAIVPSADVEHEGRGIGSRLLGGLVGAVSSGMSAVRSAMSDGLKGMASTVSSVAMPILIAALVGAAVPAGLMVGSLLGGALVLGIGAGFTGLGAMLLMQNEKIKAAFAKTGDEIKTIMIDASKPLAPVFQSALNQVKSLVKDFNPIFKDAFKDAAVPLKDFLGLLVSGFKELKPAVAPLMESFTGLLDAIGPSMEAVFVSIRDSLTDLASTVNENRGVIAGLFIMMANAVPAVIGALSWMISTFSSLLGVVNGVQATVSKAFYGATEVIMGFAEKVLGVMRSVAEAISSIPGMEDIGRKMVAGLDTAIAKVGEWKRSAQEAGKAVELKANIFDLTQKIDVARAALMDPELSKERRAKLNADIAQLIEKKTAAIVALGDPKLIKEYKSSINTEIGTLQSRLAAARKELADPNLTKERKSKLNADIAQLKAAVAQAKAALASIQNKTVHVTTIYSSVQGQKAALDKASKYAHGGIIGAAGGGPRSNMTLVGEQGPELVRLPFGSSVIPNGQTENMLSQGGAGGGVTVNLYVQGSIRSDRDLVSLIRDEFLNGGFRGATT